MSLDIALWRTTSFRGNGKLGACEEGKTVPAGRRGTKIAGEQKTREAKNASCSEPRDENASCSEHRGSLNSRGLRVLYMPAARWSVHGEL